MQKIKILYRHEIIYPVCDEDKYISDSVPTIELIKYPILKTTPCGFWIAKYEGKRWVSNNSKKRFAYPTVKESLNYFIHRKLSYVGYLNYTIKMNRFAIILAKKEYYKN